MSKKLNVVVVSGSVRKPSRTAALLDVLITQLGKLIPVNVHLVALSDIGPHLLGALDRSRVNGKLEQHLRAIESADFLVVGSPVYRASYSGLFKHLFDLVERDALVDVPVLLSATGGTERHALAIDHQLRPLFAFFRSLTLPAGIYATQDDFDHYTLSNPQIAERIDAVITQALPFLSHRTLAGTRGSVTQASKH